MDKLTLKFDYCEYFNDEFTTYLSSLEGVNFVNIDYSNDDIYVEYDSLTISLKVLKMEIMMYLNITKIPSLLAFDKHIDGCKKYTIVIKDLCCEYCLMSNIEDLLETDGIVSAYTDFDYNNKYNVNIFITYDEKIISKEEVDKINKKFNINQ